MMVNVPQQRYLKTAVFETGLSWVLLLFQRPFTQFCASVGRSVNVSHLRTTMKMGKIPGREGACTVMTNNFLNLDQWNQGRRSDQPNPFSLLESQAFRLTPAHALLKVCLAEELQFEIYQNLFLFFFLVRYCPIFSALYNFFFPHGVKLLLFSQGSLS